MNLSVIIVSFNTCKLLKNCLASFKGAEAVVVDNASTDDSIQMVKKEFPEVKLLKNKKNLGFARAVNQGIKAASKDYLFLLNPDTEVKPNSLEKLVNFVQKNPHAGVVGARLLNPDGSIQPSVYHLPTIWRAIKEYWFGQKGAYEKYIPESDSAIEVEAVTGAAMLIPKTTIEKVGLLDERFFMYFEDLDYCRRVLKAGLKVFYLPKAEIIHQHGVSGPSTQTYQYSVVSSKIYNGIIKYYLLTFIIWLGQKWQKILKRE